MTDRPAGGRQEPTPGDGEFDHDRVRARRYASSSIAIGEDPDREGLRGHPGPGGPGVRGDVPRPARRAPEPTS